MCKHLLCISAHAACALIASSAAPCMASKPASTADHAQATQPLWEQLSAVCDALAVLFANTSHAQQQQQPPYKGQTDGSNVPPGTQQAAASCLPCNLGCDVMAALCAFAATARLHATEDYRAAARHHTPERQIEWLCYNAARLTPSPAAPDAEDSANISGACVRLCVRVCVRVSVCLSVRAPVCACVCLPVSVRGCAFCLSTPSLKLFFPPSGRVDPYLIAQCCLLVAVSVLVFILFLFIFFWGGGQTMLF